jgi:drug/metabolite transporter (DMT)-like permease
MLLALACALTATVTYGVGTVLQASGARRVTSARHLDVMLLARLARQSRYIAGLALDAVGFVASLVALHTLPLFVVQAAIAGSLGVTAATAALVFGFKLRASDKLAIALLLLGLALLCISAEREPVARLSTIGEWLLLAGVFAVVAGGVVAARRHDHYAAIGLAACAGLGFAGTGIAGRALTVPSPVWHLAGEPVAIALVGYGACGVLMFASALQRGAVTATSAVMLGVETIVPATVGLTLLGDGTRPHFAILALVGFALTVGAALALARYTEPVTGEPAPARPAGGPGRLPPA